MGPVGLVANRDLRRRWRRIVLLTLLVGIAGACTLATIAGARRTSTALTRFKESSRSADVELAAAELNGPQMHALAAAPHVAAVGVLRAYGLIVPSTPDFQSLGAIVDDRFGRTVDRARIVAGRAPDPNRPDEVTVGEGLAARLGLEPGSTVTVESFSPAQVAAILGGKADVGPREGPRVALRVAAIVRRPLDLGDRGAAGGLLVLTPAFDREYHDRIGLFGDRVRVRAEHAADVPNVVAEARRILGPTVFATQDLTIETQGARNAIDVLELALWIAAAVAAIAGAVAIGVVLAREMAIVAGDFEGLRDLGMTRGQRVAVAAMSTVIVAVGGALLAAIGAVALSPLFPIGVARRADPDVGVHVDWLVVGLGVVAVMLVIFAVALAAAAWATRRTRAVAARSRRRRPSLVVERAAALGCGPSVTNGVSMAVESGRGSTSIAARSTFVAATIGVLGVAAALVFGASLDTLVHAPARYGSAWEFKTGDITPNTACNSARFGIDRIAGVAALTEVCAQNVQIDGRPTPGVAFTPVGGAGIEPQVTAGRAPRRDHEVALGARTLTALRKHVGDDVEIAGRTEKVRYRIVGRAVFPTLAAAQPLADGAAFTGAGYAPLYDQNLFNRYFVGRYVPGADRTAVDARVDAIPQLSDITGPAVPVEVDRLRQVDWLPLSLAALIGALALLAVGHALVSAIVRRRRDLALLQALGSTRQQVRATVAWHATTLGVVGVVFGIPVGVLVGDFIWGRVVDGLGVSSAAAIPVVALLVVVPCALVLVNLVAYLPARAAARVAPAVALQSD